MTRLTAVALATLLAVAACYGDPNFAAFVVNHDDQVFVLRYESRNPEDPIVAFTIPAQSSGVALAGPEWLSWRGVVVVMVSDCRLLGRVEITANPSLLTIAADGTFSVTTEHIIGRTDIDPNTLFEETSACPGGSL